MSRVRTFVSLSLAALAFTGAAAYLWMCGGLDAEVPPSKVEFEPSPSVSVPNPPQHIEVVLSENLLDDRNRADDGSSLADVVHGRLESPQFASLVDQQIRRELSAEEHCDVEVRGRCLVSSHRQVEGARFSGTSSVQFGIVGNLIVAEVRLRNLKLDIEGGVKTARVPISLRGQLEVTDIVLWTSLTLRISDHELVVDIDDSKVQLGQIDADLRGLTGRIAGSLIDRYENDIRRAAEAALTRHVSVAVSNALAESVGGVRLGPREVTLGRALGADVELTLRLITLRVSPEGIRAGLQVQVAEEPSKPASTRAATAVAGQAWASVDLGMLERCLTALWRQGVLTKSIPGSRIPGGPASVDVEATVSQQPRLRSGPDGRLLIVLPGIVLRTEVPGLGRVVVGRGEATVSAGPRLEGGALVLVDPEVEALELDGVVPTTLLAMNPTITKASIAELATAALSSVVPAIPVPTVELPGWLQQHGPSGLALTEGTVWVEPARIGITIPQIVVH